MFQVCLDNLTVAVVGVGLRTGFGVQSIEPIAWWQKQLIEELSCLRQRCRQFPVVYEI